MGLVPLDNGPKPLPKYRVWIRSNASNVLDQSKGNTCPKIDMCHNTNRSSTTGHWIQTFPKV